MLREPVTFEPYLGESGIDGVYDDPFTVLGKVATTRQMVRNANGEEVTSEATVYLHPADAAAIVPGSRVTIGTHESVVLAVSPQGRPGETVVTKVACA
jgi:hypothetical protein